MAEKKTKKDQEVTEAPEVEVTAEETEVVETQAVKELSEHDETIAALADEVMKGKHGTGRERMLSLGTNYADVQKEVTKRIRAEQFK